MKILIFVSISWQLGSFPFYFEFMPELNAKCYVIFALCSLQLFLCYDFSAGSLHAKWSNRLKYKLTDFLEILHMCLV